MARNGADTGEELTEASAGRVNEQGKRNGRGGADRGRTDPNPRGSGGGGLERVTVNLIPRASRALEQAGELTGDSKTDTINRALQVYAYLEEVWADGGSVLVKNGENVTELKFF